MDEMNNNKEKTFIRQMKSSISDTILAASPKLGNTSSFYKSYNDVDIDSVEKESNNHDFKVNREFCKLEYQRNLKRKLSDLKSRNQYNDQFSMKTKFRNHNAASLKDDVIIKNDSFSIGTNNLESDKLKTNYRTLCDFEMRKPAENVLSPPPENRLNNSGFLSMSRQSLNESVNESGISNTASRIAANIQNKSNSQRADLLNKINSNLCSKSFTMRTRRYRTIIKQDKFSSYLTRVPKEDNLFNVPNFGTSNVVLNLNCSEDSAAKRVDFSYAHVIQHHNDNNNIKAKESIDSKNIYWICVNCNSSNPSNFNFCPTCSTSNPKLVLNEKNFQPIVDDKKKIWICSRCSTKNEECRLVCIFCFKNKNFSIKKPKLDINNDEKCFVNSKTGFNFTETNSLNVDFNFDSRDKVSTQPIISSFRNENVSENCKSATTTNKWNCSVCLVENEEESGKCVCCAAVNPTKKAEAQQTKPNFVFGNHSNICAGNSSVIKFGTSSETGTDLDRDQQKFVFGDESRPIKELSTPKFVFGEGNLSKPGEINKNKWNCSECWAENEAERTKCACCSAPHPDSNKSIIFSDVSKPANSNDSSIKFGTLEPAPCDPSRKSINNNEKWSCAECWVDNDADKEKCACCTASRKQNGSPVRSIKFGSICSSQVPETTFRFGSAANEEKSSSKKWNCSECWAENEARRNKCACCGGEREGAHKGDKIPVASESTNSTGKIKFGSEKIVQNGPQVVLPFQFGSNISGSVTMATVQVPRQNGISKSAKWECPTCLVENEDSLESCACCQTKKQPSNGSNCPPVPLIFGNFSKEQAQPNQFKFGCNSDKIDNCNQKIDNGSLESTNLFDPDQNHNQLNFTFSPPDLIAASSVSSQFVSVPVDLVFEFAAPKFA